MMARLCSAALILLLCSLTSVSAEAPAYEWELFVHNDALWMVAGNNMESDVWRLRRK